MTVRNPARERLNNGELCLGIGLRQARTVDIAAAMATCGFDWLFIDLEHGTMPLDTAMQISVAALTAGISPVVRVPSRQYSLATRVLDGGALGIVMPHVDDAEEARAIVGHLKYPPLGHRSMGGGLPYYGFRAVPAGEAAATMNKETLLVVMLETPQAIANADSIAAVEGVDVLLVGTNDLMMEMGLPGQFAHPEVARAYEKVIAACRKHRKWPGMGGVYTEELLGKYVAIGMRVIIAGSDLSLLMAGAGQRAKFLRERQSS
jgi:2-keto-3-deoxy-L-rhamnonate aldolase RhmA